MPERAPEHGWMIHEKAEKARNFLAVAAGIGFFFVPTFASFLAMGAVFSQGVMEISK